MSADFYEPQEQLPPEPPAHALRCERGHWHRGPVCGLCLYPVPERQPKVQEQNRAASPAERALRITRAKALHALGANLTRIAAALGVSRSAARLYLREGD